MKDRFTKASMELTEKNPFICESCTTTYGHETIVRSEELRDYGREREGMGAECIFNCDPVPFGD